DWVAVPRCGQARSREELRLIAHSVPTNELSALAREDADARLTNSQVLTHSFVCWLGAGQERLTRRHRRSAEGVERFLNRGAVTLPALYRGFAGFVPCGFFVGIAWQLNIMLVTHLLFTFEDRPTGLSVAFAFALSG